jgi:hypothetical protein
MYMAGWSPSRNQPRAARRGSANITFEEFAAQLEGQAASEGGGGGGGGPGAAGAPPPQRRPEGLPEKPS